MSNTYSPTTGTDTAGGDREFDTDPVRSEAKRTADAVTAEAKSVAHEAQAKMAEVGDETARQAKAFAEENKGKLAAQIDSLAGALGKAADELERSDQGMIATYARDAARGISGMSSAVRDRGVDDLMQNVQQFARTQPAAFLGVAALAGFAASRFAKASSHRASTGTQAATAEQDTADSLVASSPEYPDGDGEAGRYGQGLGSSGDAASWRAGGKYPQTERGH